MNSSVIGKIEKARRYAQERDHRIRFDGLTVTVHGENDDHVVTLRDNHWSCTCDFFPGHHFCTHTMALEKVLGGMLPHEVKELALPTYH